MTESVRRAPLAWAALAAAMAITRSHHFGDALHLPDASLAVFFIAGVVCASRWVFPALLLEAGVIDWLATSIGGVRDWCLSPAYWFLIPTYACLWGGGRWLARRHAAPWRAWLPLSATVVVTSSLAFLISNGSFYLLSGRFPTMNWDEYAARVAQYYPPYVWSAAVYVAAVALVAVAWPHLRNLARPSSQPRA